MIKVRTLRAAFATAAAALLATGLAAPAAHAADDWEPPLLDGTVTITVSTWFGTEKVVAPTELASYIARPGLYTAYHINLDKAETEWAAHGGFPMLMYGFPGAPNEVYESFAGAGENLRQLGGTAQLWGGCVKTRTPLSTPADAGTVTVHAGKHCH